MDFVAVMDQVIALLRQRGRLTYRTFQLQFQVDETHLEVLKDELIYGQRLAVDEGGRVLVWAGDAATSSLLLPPSSQPASQSATSEAALPRAALPPGVSPTSEADRRQLTVLFCDLVDSTVLASQLDPEEWRAVVRAYQDVCAKVIARFEGYIAQYLWDGLLVYFGYPLAHEDDAQRAMRAGLGIVDALGQLHTRLAQEGLRPAPTQSRQWGVHLAVRLGIHTGLVVVGEVEGGSRLEQLALGETPNLAARLQGIVAPNTLVISAATLPLLGGFFVCQPLGTPLLKGIAQPLAEAVPLFAALLSLPLTAEYAPLTLAPEQQKQQSLQALLTILLRIAAQQPVLLVMEDLYWVDPTTLELLSLLVDQGPTARILALLTFRPDFSPPWTGRSHHITQVMLHRLTRQQVAEMIGRIAHGKRLPAVVVEQIVAKMDGVPLFVEELTKMVLESGLLQEREERYALTGPLPQLAIPATLHDSLMARLDRLATVKGLAQLGATLGREFSYELLHAVSPWDEGTLQRGLQQLVEAEFLSQRGLPPLATYLFKHALIQDAAYQSLLRSTRQ